VCDRKHATRALDHRLAAQPLRYRSRIEGRRHGPIMRTFSRSACPWPRAPGQRKVCSPSPRFVQLHLRSRSRLPSARDRPCKHPQKRPRSTNLDARFAVLPLVPSATRFYPNRLRPTGPSPRWRHNAALRPAGPSSRRGFPLHAILRRPQPRPRRASAQVQPRSSCRQPVWADHHLQAFATCHRLLEARQGFVDGSAFIAGGPAYIAATGRRGSISVPDQRQNSSAMLAVKKLRVDTTFHRTRPLHRLRAFTRAFETWT